jgi:hypothetical protein
MLKYDLRSHDVRKSSEQADGFFFFFKCAFSRGFLSEYFTDAPNFPGFLDELERLVVEEAGDDTNDDKDDAVEPDEWQDEMAYCSCEVSSPIDCEGGNEWSIVFDRSFSGNGEARISILSCTK